MKKKIAFGSFFKKMEYSTTNQKEIKKIKIYTKTGDKGNKKEESKKKKFE